VHHAQINGLDINPASFNLKLFQGGGVFDGVVRDVFRFRFKCELAVNILAGGLLNDVFVIEIVEKRSTSF